MTKDESRMALLYSATIFLNAALLFLVQPMIAKMITPRFGGAPAVWNTCLVFFQVMLLGGYGYAHLTDRRLGTRGQSILHSSLVLVPLLLLPFSLPEAGGSAAPVIMLIGLLAATVGLPFVLLAAGAPMLQRWYAAAPGRDPYWLYAASNAGSLLALMAYPTLLEPTMGLGAQARLWAGAYAVLAVLIWVCAWKRPRVQGPPVEADPPPDEATASAEPRMRLWWVVWAFLPSSLMMSVTTELTTALAPVPMLWVLPLAFYLLSFVLTFSPRPVVPPRVWSFTLAPLIAAQAIPSFYFLYIFGMVPYMALLVVGLFVAAMVFHGELRRTRPSASGLTEFYLWVSLGGALGGLFNAAIAPLAFNWVAEYPATLVLAAFLIPSRRPRRLGVPDVLMAAILGGVAAAVWAATARFPAVVQFFLPLGLAWAMAFRPVGFGLGVAALLVSGHFIVQWMEPAVYKERSFFGVLKVVEDKKSNLTKLVHNNVYHGLQSRSGDPRLRTLPLSYYHPTGPAGQVFMKTQASDPPRPVAVIGLGVGSLAAYGLPGQEFAFFEIDPAVVRIARDHRYFTFLEDSPAHCRVVVGDARLSLSAEPDRHYGLLVVDAFSGDTVPAHLLTREAFQLYENKLVEGGLILINITNGNFDLEPILRGVSGSLGLTCLVRTDEQINPRDARQGKQPSTWAAIARRPPDLAPFAKDPRWQPLVSTGRDAVWTDDFSDLLRVVRWW